MIKMRLEALSDGIFAIVMTLLVIEIKVPEPEILQEIIHSSHTVLSLESALWTALIKLWPVFLTFFFSFAVLANYWISHNFLIGLLAKNSSRLLGYLNLLFFAFISLIPFSTHLLGIYPDNRIAVGFYSLNMVVISTMMLIIREYIIRSKRIENPDLTNFKIDAHGSYTPMDSLYGTVRILIAVICSVLGLIISIFSTHIAITLLLIPTIIGVIPGLLGLVMTTFRLDRLAKDF